MLDPQFIATSTLALLVLSALVVYFFKTPKEEYGNIWKEINKLRTDHNALALSVASQHPTMLERTDALRREVASLLTAITDLKSEVRELRNDLHTVKSLRAIG